MSTFTNNLTKNDRVYDTVSKRQGKVANTPRSPGSRMTGVVLDGTNVPRYVDVMQLRLMPDGRTPEEVAPVDGIPPEFDMNSGPRPAPREEPEELDALTALRSELERNRSEMSGMNARFKLLQEKNDRLEKAIAALTS